MTTAIDSRPRTTVAPAHNGRQLADVFVVPGVAS